MRVLIAMAWFVLLSIGCSEYQEHDCNKIALAVATVLARDKTLDNGERRLATHLYQSVPRRGTYGLHSFDEVYKACQRIAYNPNSPI